MTSLLTEKILATLANSSSTNYIDESVLYSHGKKHDVTTALEQLLENRAIVTCQITKGGRAFHVYWLAQQLFKPKLYSELFTRERVLERTAAKKTTERHCKLCLVKKPINAFTGRSTRCAQCKKTLRATRYKLLTSQAKETTPTRWCMACKKKHPATDFGNTRSRRCVAAMLIYKQNERAIHAQKQMAYRARVKAAQANKLPASVA